MKGALRIVRGPVKRHALVFGSRPSAFPWVWFATKWANTYICPEKKTSG